MPSNGLRGSTTSSPMTRYRSRSPRAIAWPRNPLEPVIRTVSGASRPIAPSTPLAAFTLATLPAQAGGREAPDDQVGGGTQPQDLEPGERPGALRGPRRRWPHRPRDPPRLAAPVLGRGRRGLGLA